VWQSMQRHSESAIRPAAVAGLFYPSNLYENLNVAAPRSSMDPAIYDKACSVLRWVLTSAKGTRSRSDVAIT
jgi:hypothetical protein